MNQPSSNVVSMPKRERIARKRVRGQGTLEKRGEIFWMELHWHGVRHRKSLETTDRETALIKLDEEVRRIHANELPKVFEPITVQTMFENWQKQFETNCGVATQQDYQRRWTKHLKPIFGPMLATAVDRDIVVSYLHSRMKAGASLCTRNREQRVLMMLFKFNKSKIPADRYPDFPGMKSEKAHVRRGRMSNADYGTFVARLNTPSLFWLKVFLVMTFKYGFRKSELLKARVSYFDRESSTFILPAFSTKNKLPRVVAIVPNGEIYKMLVQLVGNRAPEEALLVRDDGKPVKDLRAEWKKQTAGMKGGSSNDGSVTIHDLRRSAITNMNEKGIGSTKAGTHLSGEVFARYITRTLEEQRETSRTIEGD
jgi:integrase